MAYYDPNTWKAVDASNVLGRATENGTSYFDLSGYNGGAQAFKNRFLDENGNYNAGMADQFLTADPETGIKNIKAGDPTQGWIDSYAPGAVSKNWLTGLAGQGYTANDFENARNAYYAGGGRGGVGDSAWSGDQAYLRLLGTGFDSLGKNTNWNSLYNPNAETAQQQ
jgi:hypothetical protein